MMEFIFICFCVASISYTISATSIFEGFREAVSPLHKKIEELVYCPYCLGHYVTIFVLLVTGYRIDTNTNVIVDYLFTIFAVMGAVACLHFLITRAYEPIAKNIVYRDLKRLKNKKE